MLGQLNSLQDQSRKAKINQLQRNHTTETSFKSSGDQQKGVANPKADSLLVR